MPNLNQTWGFRPVSQQSSAPYSGGARTYAVPASDATALYIGDPVKIAGTATTQNGVVYPDVIAAATGDVVTGVVIGILPDVATSLPYRVASTLRLVQVVDDPNILFEIQEVTTGTPLVAADIGLNINFVAAAGSTITGRSGFALDNTTEATTNTLDLKIIDVANRSDNDIGSAGTKFLVRFNRHRFVNQVAGV